MNPIGDEYGNAYGCYFSEFGKSKSPNNTSVIELGSFEISDPQVIKGFKISSSGYVNDSFALAIGQTKPEQVVYVMPRELCYTHFNLNTVSNASINLKTFKLYIIVHQDYKGTSANTYLANAIGSPTATVETVQNAMSSECRANDAMTTNFTDGFYVNSFNVEMVFDYIYSINSLKDKMRPIGLLSFY